MSLLCLAGGTIERDLTVNLTPSANETAPLATAAEYSPEECPKNKEASLAIGESKSFYIVEESD